MGFAPLRLAREPVAPHVVEARRLQTCHLLPPHVVVKSFAQTVVAVAPWLPVRGWLGGCGEDLLWSVGRAVAGDGVPLRGGRAGTVVPIGDHVVPCFEATRTMVGIVEVFFVVSIFFVVPKKIVFQLALLALQALQFKLSFLNFPVTHQLALQLAF